MRVNLHTHTLPINDILFLMFGNATGPGPALEYDLYGCMLGLDVSSGQACPVSVQLYRGGDPGGIGLRGPRFYRPSSQPRHRWEV